MICTHRDQYMKSLTRSEMMISWKIKLSDGTDVYGDYDRPDTDNPWIRLSEHCKDKDVSITKVELHMFGTPKLLFFEDENGLDGVSVMRGIAKEQSMTGNHSESFQTLTVCLLRDCCSWIDVKKYTWPLNEFEEFNQTRAVTKQNLEYMIFKNGSEKLKNPKVQELINGATL
jgi:hypothetical protein